MEKVARDTDGGEEEPMLAKEEREQLSIQDDRAEESRCPKDKQLKPEHSKQQADTGQPNQCYTEPLPSFEVQVIRGFPALKNQARPGNSAREHVRPDDRTEGPPL